MKPRTTADIPLYRMESLAPIGMTFRSVDLDEADARSYPVSRKNTVHRDDYFLFLILEEADALLVLDFEEIAVRGCSLLYIRPGQVHFAPRFGPVRGWALAIDPALIDERFRSLFDEPGFRIQQPLSPPPERFAPMAETARSLRSLLRTPASPLRNGTALHLANALVGLIAREYADLLQPPAKGISRSAEIAQKFKELLVRNCKSVKSPARYAALMHCSPAHLNASVKEATGFPAGCWIRREIVLEAKRLLCHTELPVKEIAFRLGYDDPSYFTRIFTRTTGMPPERFRRKFRE